MSAPRFWTFAFSLSALPLATPAHAVDVSRFCALPQTIRPFVVNCETNYIAVDAGTTCLKGLQNQITLAQAKLASGMAAAAVGSSASQLGKLQNETTDIAAMQATLADLIAQAGQVREQLTQYLDGISYPGGVSRAEAAALGLTEQFSSFLCFTSCEDAVKQEISAVDEKIAQLKESGIAAAGIQSKSDLAILALSDSPASAGPVSATRGTSGRAQTVDASSITGQVKDPSLATALANQRVPAGHAGDLGRQAMSTGNPGEGGLFTGDLTASTKPATKGASAGGNQARALSDAEAAIKALLDPASPVPAPGPAPTGANGSSAMTEAKRALDPFLGGSPGATDNTGFSPGAATFAASEGNLGDPDIFTRVHQALVRANTRGAVR